MVTMRWRYGTEVWESMKEIVDDENERSSNGYSEIRTDFSYLPRLLLLSFYHPSHVQQHTSPFPPSTRLLEIPMHKPTKALPQHLIPPPQPLQINFPRQPNNPYPEREFNLPIRLIHIHNTLFLLALISATVSAAPHVLTRFADTSGCLVVPFPGKVERGELRVDS